MKDKKIKITKNGPYLVEGGLPLAKEIIAADKSGVPIKWTAGGERYPDQDKYKLCRCGQSANKPFCDNTHIRFDFDGTETASRARYLDAAKEITGPEMNLADWPPLCASARFCHRAGGTWRLTDESADPQKKAEATQEAGDCPSGRLTASKKNGQAIEPKFEPSIGIVEDPSQGVSGPLWVKGGVLIESADGTEYEQRNRVTLCRCGKSANKPFCDGQHIQAEFNDGDESLTK